MTPKKIILLRHGQTDFNLRGIVQGSGVDSSLNETGEKQANDFYQAFHQHGFDILYTSTLKRTHETVKRFIDDGLAWHVLKDLNEISWGKQEGKAISAEEDKYYQWMLEQWRLGDTSHKITGGESPDEVAMRLRRALEVITTSTHQNILICMHGRAMRVMLCLLLDYPLASMDLFEHQNACVYELQFSDLGWQILRHNDVEHLVGMKWPVASAALNTNY